jgi:hypothetical protein
MFSCNTTHAARTDSGYILSAHSEPPKPENSHAALGQRRPNEPPPPLPGKWTSNLPLAYHGHHRTSYTLRAHVSSITVYYLPPSVFANVNHAILARCAPPVARAAHCMPHKRHEASLPVSSALHQYIQKSLRTMLVAVNHHTRSSMP